MPIEIRRITPSDAPQLKSVRLAALAEAPYAFGSTFEGESKLTDDDWAHRATRTSSGDERTMFLAFDRDQAVGLAGGMRSGSVGDCVEVVSMWTSPTVRRTGTARRLIDAVTDWAIEGGATSAELWVTRGNDPAQRLYESMGFVETDDYQPVPSDPCAEEVRMQRPLG